jgi:hypothetical protein
MAAMRISYLFAVLLLPFLLLAAACGDDGDGDDADETPTGTPGGNDEDYLKAICSGTQEISNALITKTTPEEIGEVIELFIQKMKEANPPDDLEEYNAEFIQYLEDSLADPTSVVTRTPPLPSDDIQRRLAGKEITVDECKDGTFFSRNLPEGG